MPSLPLILLVGGALLTMVLATAVFRAMDDLYAQMQIRAKYPRLWAVLRIVMLLPLIAVGLFLVVWRFHLPLWVIPTTIVAVGLLWLAGKLRVLSTGERLTTSGGRWQAARNWVVRAALMASWMTGGLAKAQQKGIAKVRLDVPTVVSVQRLRMVDGSTFGDVVRIFASMGGGSLSEISKLIGEDRSEDAFTSEVNGHLRKMAGFDRRTLSQQSLLRALRFGATGMAAYALYHRGGFGLEGLPQYRHTNIDVDPDSYAGDGTIQLIVHDPLTETRVYPYLPGHFRYQTERNSEGKLERVGTSYMETPAPLGQFADGVEFALLMPYDRVLVQGAPGSGKALPTYIRVPTPLGYTTMGDLKVGDEVFTLDGSVTTVTCKSALQVRPSYRVVFSTGEAIEACEDHQWFVQTQKQVFRARRGHKSAGYVHTTRELVELGVLRSSGRARWYVPVAEAVQLPARDLLLDPYVLGYWLANGSARKHGSIATITAHAQDVDEVLVQFAHAGWSKARDTYFPAGTQTAQAHIAELQGCLRSMGLEGHKHIPVDYMRASYDQRLALLQGLLDGDGHHAVRSGRKSRVQLELADKTLAMQARELVCSLGMRPGVVTEATRNKPYKGQDRWLTTWTFTFVATDKVFRLQRKLADLTIDEPGWRQIVAVEPLDNPPPMQCIAVDHPSHLYLVGESFIPTHNSAGMDNLIAFTIECHDCLTLIADFKGGMHMWPWRQAVAAFAMNPMEGDEMFDWLVEEMEHRMTRYGEGGQGVKKVGAYYQQGGQWHYEPWLAVFIDEMHEASKNTLDQFEKLVRLGRAVGIELIGGTQYATSERFPRGLLVSMPTRLSTYVTDTAAAMVAMGSRNKVSPDRIPATKKYRGTYTVATEHGLARYMKAYWLADLEAEKEFRAKLNAPYVQDCIAKYPRIAELRNRIQRARTERAARAQQKANARPNYSVQTIYDVLTDHEDEYAEFVAFVCDHCFDFAPVDFDVDAVEDEATLRDTLREAFLKIKATHEPSRTADPNAPQTWAEWLAVSAPIKKVLAPLKVKV